MSNWPLYIRQAGDPAQPTICFLHGFLGSHREWQPWLDAWSDRYHTVGVDLPGHGLTPSHDEEELYTVPGAARALATWLKRSGHAPAHIIGYSLGGRIALALACRYPECCQRVVIESSSPGLLDARIAAERVRHDEQWAQHFENEPLDAVLQDWYQQPLFASLHTQPRAFARMLAQRRDNRPREIARVMRGMGVGAQSPLWDELPRMACDVLVLTGESDRKYCAIATRMAAQSPRIQCATVPRAGHNAHLEAPDEWAQRVRAFLDNHSKQTRKQSPDA